MGETAKRRRMTPGIPASPADRRSTAIFPVQCVPTRPASRHDRASEHDVIYVARESHRTGRLSSKWCNPFKVHEYGREEAIRRYSAHLDSSPDLLRDLPQLAGRKLECWCKKDEDCHADVIIKKFTELHSIAQEKLNSDAAAGLKFLLLFSGPADRTDSIANILRGFGAEVDEFDVINEPELQNLASMEVWEKVLRDCRKGRYDGAGFMPPCSTLSAARTSGEGESSPRALRGPEGPDLYGFRDLRSEDKEKARMGTLLASRAAEAAFTLAECRRGIGVPWFFETLRVRNEAPSVFKLNCVLALDALPEGIRRAHFKKPPV